jgi:glycosyltransferase involved in cell wall biosynthesis
MWWLFHQAYWPGRWLLNQADAVVTVSQTSKQLIKQRRLTRRPIRVVYNAPLPTKPYTTAKPPTIDKNLIFMGSFMPYKNVETLVSALFFLPEYRLHCLTRISDTRKQELLSLAPPNQVVFHNGVSDEEYEQLLSSAHALVTASKSEGFGLPVIEAMQLGVPVICSDLPIFHEVAGKSALFFAPDNQTEFAKQVVKLENEKVRAHLIKSGFEQAKKFNWDDSAQALLKIAKDISE